MPTRELFATSADGTQIWGEEAGDPAKPALVLVHGLACTAFVFDRQFADARLLAGLHLVRYELRGHGRSDMPVDSIDAYSSRRYAEDFKAVCDAFGLVRPWLLGWSLGGLLPVDIVDTYGADFLAGIVYASGPALSLRLNDECFPAPFRAAIPGFLSADASVTARLAATFVDSCMAEPIPYATKLLWMGGYAAQPPIIRQYAIGRQQDDARWMREARKLPVLLVQGTADSHCLWERMLEQLKSVYVDVEVRLIEGVGHALHYERWEDMDRFVLDFVQRKSQK